MAGNISRPFGSAVGGYFRDRAEESLESNRLLQEQINRNLGRSNSGGGDSLSVSKAAEREALFDKIQGMIDRGESLRDISFEDFQGFCYDRYGMPISKNQYDLLFKASGSREHFDKLLREMLGNWENGKNITDQQKDFIHRYAGDTSYSTYARFGK